MFSLQETYFKYNDEGRLKVKEEKIPQGESKLLKINENDTVHVVLRNAYNEVNRNFEGVCQYIDNAVKESLRQTLTDTSL